MATKMADLSSAMNLMEDLRKASFDLAKEEYKELYEFAKTEQGFGEEKLQHWDVTYYAEKLKEAKYKFNEEELKPYFSLGKVQDGLWALANRLFGITVKRIDQDKERLKELFGSAEGEDVAKSMFWHPDVQFFEIRSEETQELISFFYFDPYSRPGTKKGGAWMSDVVGKSKNKKLVSSECTILSGGKPLRIPVAHMVCNQSPPVDDKPSLMTFREVETLFHEFGHALQHMLTKEEEGSASGISLVEWDAVEQPSQFMENWCYDKNTVDKMATHWQTGETIPDELFQKLLKAKNYRSATGMVRQVHFAILDLKLHSEYDPKNAEGKTVYDMDKEVSEICDALPIQEYDRFLNGFAHIFAGGYAAGYFSYKWAEVLSADCFAAFEEVGLENEEKVRETGKRFRDTVLGLGGGQHPSEVFRAFRGRDPTPEALLRHSGLTPAGDSKL